MCLKITVYNKCTIINLLKGNYSNVEIDALVIKSKDLIHQGHKNLILNMVHLKDIDDKFINGLKVIHMYSIQKEGHLSLCSPGNEIEDILYWCGMERIIKIYSNELQAIAFYENDKTSKIA